MAQPVNITPAIAPVKPTTPQPSGISSSVGSAVLTAVSASLTRKGFLTSEWWTAVIGAGLSAVVALVGVQGPTGTQIVSVLAPALLAASYAVVRTIHKSKLAALLGDIFPQSGD